MSAAVDEAGRQEYIHRDHDGYEISECIPIPHRDRVFLEVTFMILQRLFCTKKCFCLNVDPFKQQSKDRNTFTGYVCR